MPQELPSPRGSANRRDFLKQGAAAGLAGSLLAGFDSSAVYAAGSDVLRVGLVGCGGRGTGAANQALSADPHTELVAMGDAFPEQIEQSLKSLKRESSIADRVTVTPEHMFSGLDAYRYVIDSCDVVLLATPPGFRPSHIEYAVEKGKHIFTEKPMATDATGVRSLRESVQRAKEKKLGIQTGFCWRYQTMAQEFFQRILDGKIGDLLCFSGAYLAGPVKPMPDAATRPEGMSDLEWMVRNWYNFTWLSGDGLVEQAVHIVDWIGWAKRETPPKSCVALGGRQIPAKGGNIFDHVSVNYEWEDGTRAFMAQRQITGCFNDYSGVALGTRGRGRLDPRGARIEGEETWAHKGPLSNMFLLEHEAFLKSIRDGQPLNFGDRMINSTLLAIMGRMSAYTGKQVTWEMAANSQESLVPETPNWNAPVEFPTMALPGLTPFA